ncbi:MAG: ATP-binding cassette domain-containing protein, partial [Bdellovibrionales bacterium]|nr:ATP-binding cassette domain-containing protein [Bdellovibrionales bacterium]
SGKSLLLKFMSGLIRPNKGQVFYRGKDLSTLSKKESHQFLSEVGMLFQQNALFDSMTVFNNLDFVLKEVREDLSVAQRKEEIMEFLKAVGLDHVPNLYPGELSGGMQKRLGIARALVLKPRLVFYDDPTAGLDPITSRHIIQMILDLKEKLGATIVTVTHDMMRAYQLAGEIMVCFHQDFIKTGSDEQTRAFNNPKVQQFIKGEVQGPLEAL